MAWIHIVLEFLVGIGLLVWAADRFIIASGSIARNLGISPLVIGMVLVGFGTSFPELVVSAIAAWNGNASLAIGNAIGSNIANIGLVVGVTVLFVPISIHSRILKREFPILIFVSLIIGALMLNNFLSRMDGLILLLALGIQLYWTIFIAPKRHRGAKDAMVREYESELPPKMKLKKAIVWWLIGLVLLFVASELVVSSATTMAKLLHMSNLVIGLTIVAIGTSLPELAATLVSALRRENDIAIGNIVGSNIFNMLAVMAMPALLAPGRLPPHVLTRDYPLMLLFTFIFWLIPFTPPHKGRITRSSGFVLLFGFIAYLVYLGMSV